MTPLIAVLVPTRGLIFTKVVEALMCELAPYEHSWCMTDNLPLPHSRNALVDWAQGSGLPFTHYLLVDDDTVIPQGGLKAMLESGNDVSVIDYPSHWGGKGANTGLAVYHDWLAGQPVEGKELFFAGLGCVLVTHEAMAVVTELNDGITFRKGGRKFDRDANGKVIEYDVGSGHGGEDYEFFQDCRKLGLKVAVMHGYVAGHAKVMRHIGVITPDKYVSQHDISINSVIERPLK